MQPPTRNELRPISRWVHLGLGAFGVTAGRFWVDGVRGELLILGAITYVAWTARRAAGLSLALGAMVLQPSNYTSATPLESIGPWLLVYSSVAFVSSAIETATRPRSS